MTRPRVPEMVEMFENNDTHMISYSEPNNDGIYPLADSPQLLRPPSLPNILDPSPPLTPASPRYLASTLRRKQKSSLLPGHQEPISSMAIDVDETRVDKFLKIYKLVKETIFYPFLYTTRGIEAKFGKATASYFMLLLRFLLMNLVCLLLNTLIWIPRLLEPFSPPVYEIGPWLDSIAALITGKGWEFTILFMGNYSSGNINGTSFNKEAAYFSVFFAITFAILVILAYWLFQAYLKTVSVQSTYTSVERFIFLGWDYSIDHSLQAVLKQQSNYIALKELLQELGNKPSGAGRDERNQSYIKLAIRWSLRALGWGITLLLLLIGASLIVCSGQQRYQTGGGTVSPKILIGFVPSFWHTFLEITFPIVILLEGYKVKANHLNALLFKYLLMRIVSLFAICLLITQSYVLSKSPIGSSCTFIPFQFCVSPDACKLKEIVNYECWETQAGRIFYEYIMAQFISSIIFRSSVLVVQNLIRKSISYCFRTIPSFVRSPRLHKVFEYGLRSEFHVSKHVMKIIYIQCLIWCGMLFSPFITLIGFLGFLLLYFTMLLITKLTSQHSPPPPRISKSNLSYYGILVFMFFIIMILLHWPIFYFIPSPTCGPFRNETSIYNLFPKFLQQLQGTLTIDVGDTKMSGVVADFLNSPALGPLLIVLLTTSSILIAVIRKKNKEIREINTSNQFIFSRYKELFTHELVTMDYSVKQRQRLEQTTAPVRKSRKSVSNKTHFEQFRLHLY